MKIYMLILLFAGSVFGQEIDQYDDVAKFEWAKTSEKMHRTFYNYLDEYNLSEDQENQILELNQSALKNLAKDLLVSYASDLENGQDQLASLFSESYYGPITRAGGYVCSKSNYIRLVEFSYWAFHSNMNVKLDMLVVNTTYWPFVALLETKYDCHAFM